MVNRRKVITKVNRIQIILLCVVILVILLAGVYLYNYYFLNKSHNFIIENKYYGFQLQTPKNWIGEENTSYSDNIISETLGECKNNNLTGEIGVFRFESQKFPDDLDFTKLATTGFPSGTILEVVMNCVKGGIKDEINKYIYISPKDKNIEEKLRKNYVDVFDKIISSFKIIK